MKTREVDIIFDSIFWFIASSIEDPIHWVLYGRDDEQFTFDYGTNIQQVQEINMKNLRTRRVIWTLVAVAVLLAGAFTFQQMTSQASVAQAHSATFAWDDGTKTDKPWKVVFGSDTAIVGVIDYQQRLFFVSVTGDIESAGITVSNTLPTDVGMPWTTVWGDSSLMRGVIVMQGLEYLTSTTDVEKEVDCCSTCTQTAVTVTIQQPTPSPTSTNTSGTTSTPGIPTVTATPGNPPTRTPVPTNTPVPTVKPTSTPKPDNGNCGVGQPDLDPDTPGCQNGRNDGPGTGPGHPGSQGGNGNNDNKPEKPAKPPKHGK